MVEPIVWIGFAVTLALAVPLVLLLTLSLGLKGIKSSIKQDCKRRAPK